MKNGLVWEKSVDQAHLDLRFDVLREGLPRGTEHYPGIDEDPELPSYALSKKIF